MSWYICNLYCLLKIKTNLHTDKMPVFVYPSNSGYNKLILMC